MDGQNVAQRNVPLGYGFAAMNQKLRLQKGIQLEAVTTKQENQVLRAKDGKLTRIFVYANPKG